MFPNVKISSAHRAHPARTVLFAPALAILFLHAMPLLAAPEAVPGENPGSLTFDFQTGRFEPVPKAAGTAVFSAALARTQFQESETREHAEFLQHLNDRLLEAGWEGEREASAWSADPIENERKIAFWESHQEHRGKIESGQPHATAPGGNAPVLLARLDQGTSIPRGSGERTRENTERPGQSLARLDYFSLRNGYIPDGSLKQRLSFHPFISPVLLISHFSRFSSITPPVPGRLSFQFHVSKSASPRQLNHIKGPNHAFFSA